MIQKWFDLILVVKPTFHLFFESKFKKLEHVLKVARFSECWPEFIVQVFV